MIYMKKVGDLNLVSVLTLNLQLCLLNARLFLKGGKKNPHCYFGLMLQTNSISPQESSVSGSNVQVSPLLCFPKHMPLTYKEM